MYLPRTPYVSLRLALLPALLLACVLGLAQVEVPLEFSVYVPTARFLIEGQPATMIVDTGAGITVLDARFADTLGIAIGKQASVQGAGQEVSVRRIERVQVALPGERPVPVPAVALPLQALSRQMGRRIDGVVGAHFLQQYTVEFDYPGGKARFFTKGAFSPPPTWKALPLRLEEGRPAIAGTLVGTGSSRYQGHFLLDSGSNHAVTLLPRFAARHKLPPKDVPALEDPGLGIAGPSPAVLWRMEGFQLGDLTFPAVFVRARSTGSGGEFGLIGGAMLRQLRFAVDYPGKRLYLAAGSDFGQSSGVDLAGLRISWEGEDYARPRIQDVVAGRAGSKAGLLPGDEIVEPRLSPNQLAEQLRRPETNFNLMVQRGDERIPVELKLEPLFAGQR